MSQACAVYWCHFTWFLGIEVHIFRLVLSAVSSRQCCSFKRSCSFTPALLAAGDLSGAVWGVNALLEGTIAGGYSQGSPWVTSALRLGVAFQFLLKFPHSPQASLCVLAGESFPLMDDVTEFRVDAGRLRSKSPFFNFSLPPFQTPTETQLSAC